jgi:O-antigen/teichoic acid export membrane protein
MRMMPTENDTAPAPAGLGSLLNHSTLYFAGNIVSRVVGFVMIPFYAHFLSTDEYGVLNLLEVATTVAAIAFGLQSVGPALTRISHDQADATGRRRAMSTALLATLALAGVVMASAMAGAAPIARAISLPGQAGLLRAAFAGMFFGVVVELLLVEARMRGRVGFVLTYLGINLVATLSLNILLIGFLHQGVWGFVISKLAVTGAGFVVLLVRAVREVGVVWDGALAGALARFGGPLVVSAGCAFAIHSSDRLFLAHVSRAEVGVYALAYNFAFLLSVLVGESFNSAWNVSLYGLASGEGWQGRFVQVGRWLVLALAAGAVGISLFGRDVLTLMVPASYYPPVLLLPVLVFAYLLREVGDFFGSMLLIGAGSGLVGRIAALGAALNLALNALMIPAFGIWGAAWATFATWAAYCALCWVSAWRRHGVAMSPAALAAGLGLSGLCLCLRLAVSPSGALVRLATDAACFGLFLGLSAIVYMRADERGQAWLQARRAMAMLLARKDGAKPVSQ